MRNDDEISNQDNEEVTDLNKKRQSDVAGQEPETFINGNNTLVEREKPSQDQVKQKLIKTTEIGTQPYDAQHESDKKKSWTQQGREKVKKRETPSW